MTPSPQLAPTAHPVAVKPTPIPTDPTAAPAPPAQAAASTRPRRIVKRPFGFPTQPFVDVAFRSIGIQQGDYRDQGIDLEVVHALQTHRNKSLIAGEIESIDTRVDGILAANADAAGPKNVGVVIRAPGTSPVVRKTIAASPT